MSTSNELIKLGLSGLLGGTAIGAVLTFLKDRRKATTDYTVATYQTLAEFNDRLNNQITGLEQGRDEDRARRREMEEKLANEMYARRRLEYDLSVAKDRNAELEADVAELRSTVEDLKEQVRAIGSSPNNPAVGE